MSEKILTKDFLSKETIAQLYKDITLKNEYTNLNKQQKDFIINNLIETMKRIYKTLDFTKINNNNILNIKNQFNTIVVKQTSDLIKNNINKVEPNNNQRTIDRTFNSVKQPQINITSIDRPTSSLSGTQIMPAQMKVSDDFIKKTSGDISTRLAELENSRRTNNFNKPTDIPDFLKSVKVGKEDSFSNNNYNYNNNNNNNNNHKERKLEGFGDMQDNFNNNSGSSNVDMSKYSDNMSIQDRLKKLESERQMPSINPPMPQSQSQPQHQHQPPPQSQMQQYQMPQPQMPQPQMPQYQMPSQPQYQPQPQPQYQPQMPQYQVPSQPQHQQHQTQYHTNNQSDELIQQMNEMKKMLNMLKEENEHLKNQSKNKPSVKTLQLDINKTTATYKFQFNPINNIVSLKLLSYNLPNPVYNIFETINFVYEINNKQNNINIMKGFYTIDMLLNNLNNNNDLIFSIDYTQKVSIKSKETSEFIIKPSYLSFKLGFNNEDNLSSTKTAQRIYDLRLPSKLLLYIKNINQNPVCILNFNNSSVCNLQFNNPLTISSLDLEFYTEDNILYNFNDLPYNLSFALDILNDS